MYTEAAVYSIKGRTHHLNEDRYRILNQNVPVVSTSDKGHLYAIIDGVGSAPLGMKAAQYIVDKLHLFFTDKTIAVDIDGLKQLLLTINQQIFEWGYIENTTRTKGAAAASVAWLSPGQALYILHAGDTTVFQYSDEKPIQTITAEHHQNNAIQRYFGQGEQLILDVMLLKPQEGDVFCMVTDGVTAVLRGADIESIVQECVTPERIAKEIAGRASRRGSQDDITALVIALDEW